MVLVLTLRYVHDVDEEEVEFVIDELNKVGSKRGTDFFMSFPTVFIGGRT